MIRKLAAVAAAIAFALTTLAPVSADARDRRGYHGRHHDGYYDRRHWRDRDDDDALAAGVVGLVLGLAIGAAASQPRDRYDRCYDRCAPPPPRCSDRCGYDRGYEEGYYDPRYDDRRSAYERDYGGYYEEERCVRQERQWDRYARRYVTVDVPC